MKNEDTRFSSVDNLYLPFFVSVLPASFLLFVRLSCVVFPSSAYTSGIRFLYFFLLFLTLIFLSTIHQLFCRLPVVNRLVPLAPFVSFIFIFLLSLPAARLVTRNTKQSGNTHVALWKYFSLFTLCTSLHTMRSKWEDIDFRITNYRQSGDEYLSILCYTRFSNLDHPTSHSHSILSRMKPPSAVH